MIADGVRLAIIGITVVFAFLLLLVFVTSLISRLGSRLAPAAAPQSAGSNDAEIAAAVAVAKSRTGHRTRGGSA